MKKKVDKNEVRPFVLEAIEAIKAGQLDPRVLFPDPPVTIKNPEKAVMVIDLDFDGTPERGGVQLWVMQSMRINFQDMLAAPDYPELRREVIGCIAEGLRNRTPIPAAMIEWLQASLKAIQAGADPAEAFGIDTRKNAPKLDRLKRLNQIARFIWGFMNQGSTLEVAKEKTVEHLHRLNVTEGQATLAWEVWGHSYNDLSTTGNTGMPNLAPLRRGRRKKT